MVFGTTYCAISHLPIEDGDKCILIPLGFNMKYNFTQFNNADINAFMYLYTFIAEPVEVVYSGNPDDIKYESHELFMLVHKEFYMAIQREFMMEGLKTTENLPLFKTIHDIWEKAKEFEKDHREKERMRMVNEDITKEEFLKSIMKTPTPDWMKSLYKIAMFMDGMGMIPYPNHCVDQHKRNELYEKLREQCKKQNV